MKTIFDPNILLALEASRRNPADYFNRGVKELMGIPLIRNEYSPIKSDVGGLMTTAMDFAPVSGEMTAAADTKHFAEKGEYGMAGLSAIGMIPVVGMAVKPFRAAKEAGDVFYSKLLTAMENFPRKATMQNYKDMIFKLVEKGTVKKSEAAKLTRAMWYKANGVDNGWNETINRTQLEDLYHAAVPEPKIVRSAQTLDEFPFGGSTFHGEYRIPMDDGMRELPGTYSENVMLAERTILDDLLGTRSFENPGHFGGAPNNVGWTRTYGYTNPEGKTGRMFMEAQSDWAAQDIATNGQMSGGVTRYPYDPKDWSRMQVAQELHDIGNSPFIEEMGVPGGKTVASAWGYSNPDFHETLYDQRIPKEVMKMSGSKAEGQKLATRTGGDTIVPDVGSDLKESVESGALWFTDHVFDEIPYQESNRAFHQRVQEARPLIEENLWKAFGPDVVEAASESGYNGNGLFNFDADGFPELMDDFASRVEPELKKEFMKHMLGTGDIEPGYLDDHINLMENAMEFIRKIGNYPIDMGERSRFMKITDKMREKMKGPHPLFSIGAIPAMGLMQDRK